MAIFDDWESFVQAFSNSDAQVNNATPSRMDVENNQTAKESKKLLGRLVELLKNITNLDDHLAEIDDLLLQIKKDWDKRGVSQKKQDKLFNNFAEKLLKIQLKQLKLTGSGQQTKQPKEKSARDLAGDLSDDLARNAADKARSRMVGMATTISSLVGGGGVKQLVAQMTDGVKEGLEFNTNMRETLYITEGITGSMRDMQWEVTNVNDVVGRTGNTLANMKKVVENLTKKGLRGAAKEVAIISGNLSKMLDTDVTQTAEMFSDWNMSLGQSESQLSQIARNAKMVAKETGITGDKLLGVMRTSERFMKNMRSASTLAGDANKTIMSALANAEKNGSTERVTEMLEALTKVGGVYDVDPLLRGNMIRAASEKGLFEELRGGRLMKSKDNVKVLADQMKKQLLEQTGFNSIKDLEDPNNQDRVAQLNMQRKSAGSAQIGDELRAIEALESSSRTYTDILKALDVEMKKTNGRTSDKLKLEEEARRYEENTGLEVMTKFQEQMDFVNKTASQAATDALNELQKNNQETFSNLEMMTKKFGLNMQDPLQAMQAAALTANEAMKKAGGTDMAKEINAAYSSGSKELIAKLEKDLSAEQQRLDVQNKAKAGGPMAESALNMQKLNETITSRLIPALVGLTDAVGGWGMTAMQFGGGLVELGSMAVGMFGSLEGLTTAITGGLATAWGWVKSVGSGMQTMWKWTKPLVGAIRTIGVPIALAAGALNGLRETVFGVTDTAKLATTAFGTTYDKLNATQKIAVGWGGMIYRVFDSATLGIGNWINSWIGGQDAFIRGVDRIVDYLTNKVSAAGLGARSLMPGYDEFEEFKKFDPKGAAKLEANPELMKQFFPEKAKTMNKGAFDPNLTQEAASSKVMAETQPPAGTVKAAAVGVDKGVFDKNLTTNAESISNTINNSIENSLKQGGVNSLKETISQVNNNKDFITNEIKSFADHIAEMNHEKELLSQIEKNREIAESTMVNSAGLPRGDIDAMNTSKYSEKEARIIREKTLKSEAHDTSELEDINKKQNENLEEMKTAILMMAKLMEKMMAGSATPNLAEVPSFIPEFGRWTSTTGGKS